MNDRLLGSAEAVKALAEQLSRVPSVENASTPHDEPPSWTLADSLGDIERECRRLLDVTLPQLVRESTPEELGSTLVELRAALMHIVYHLATTPWSRSLIDDAPPLFEEK